MQIINGLIQGTSLFNLTGKKWFFDECKSQFAFNDIQNYTLNSCCYPDESNGGVITCPLLNDFGILPLNYLICNGQMNCAFERSYTCNATPNTTQQTANACSAFDGPASDQLYNLQDYFAITSANATQKSHFQKGYMCKIAYTSKLSCTNATIDPKTYTEVPYCSLPNSSTILYPLVQGRVTDLQYKTFTCDGTLQCGGSSSSSSYVCKCDRNDSVCPVVNSSNSSTTLGSNNGVGGNGSPIPWWVYVAGIAGPIAIITVAVVLHRNREKFTARYRKAKREKRAERKEQKRKDRLKELDDRKHGAELYKGRVENRVQARQLEVNKERAAVEEEGKAAIERARQDIRKAELAIEKMRDDIASKNHELEENKKQMFKATKQELFKLQAEQEEITRQRELLYFEQQDLQRKLQRKKDNFDIVMKYSTARDEDGKLVPQIEITATHTAQTKEELARLPQQITFQNQQFQGFTNNLIDAQRAIGAPPPGTSSGLLAQAPPRAALQPPPRGASQGTLPRNAGLPYDVRQQ